MYNDCCPDFDVNSCPTLTPTTDELGPADGGPISRDLGHVRNKAAILQRDQLTQTGDEYVKCIQTVDFYAEERVPRLGHRLISFCPVEWDDPTGIRELCQKDIGFVASIQGTPVSAGNNSHYKNVFCALCHGVALGDVKYWVSFFNKRPQSITYYFNNTMLVHMDRFHSKRQTMRRSVRPFMPNDYGRGGERQPLTSPRSCVVEDVTSCPQRSSRTEVDICHDVYAPVVLNVTTYRNMFCIECAFSQSGLTVDCLRSLSCSYIDPHSSRSASMASIMIFSDRTETNMYSTKKILGVPCSSTQVYDPYLESCRDLMCPSGHALAENGAKCVRVQTSAAVGAGARLTIGIEGGLTVTGSFHDERISDGNATMTWEETVARKSVDNFLLSALLKEEDLSRNNGSYCQVLNLTWVCLSVDLGILPSSGACTQKNTFRCHMNVSCECSAPPTARLMNFNRMVQETCFQGGFWNSSIRLDAFMVATPCNLSDNELRNTTNASDYRSTRFTEMTVTWDDSTGEFKQTNLNDYCEESTSDCPLLKFSKADYIFTGTLNGSIKLVNYDGIVFHSGEYKLLANGAVEVCSFLMKGARSSDGNLDELAHLILTVVGSCVSLIGLMVTITTYIAFPALRRNVAGKSLMSLVASLFFAQATMIIGKHDDYR